MKTLCAALVALMTAAAILAACAAPPIQVPPTKVPATLQPTSLPDLLSTILARGTVVIATASDYAPQASLKANSQRLAATKCASDQKTIAELEGFDIDVAVAIAKGVGVEPCFVIPSWSLITIGGWAGRWDISVGSMTITTQRAKALYFAQPYYMTPATLYVHETNATYSKASDLDGRKIGICEDCVVFRDYLDGTLTLPGQQTGTAIKNATIMPYIYNSGALAALAQGDGNPLDAVLTPGPEGKRAMDSGKAIKQLGDPLFSEYLAPAIDRQSPFDPHSFVAAVSAIIAGLHKDGTLLKLSQQWYKEDLTSAAATYDASALGK